MDGFKFDRFPIAVAFKGYYQLHFTHLRIEDRKKGGGPGKGGPTSADICFNCGKLGHWLIFN